MQLLHAIILSHIDRQALKIIACNNFIAGRFMCNCRMQLVQNLGGASCQSLRAPQCGSGVTTMFTSKMFDEDELLLLSAAASAATIVLAACSVKRRRINVLNDFGSQTNRLQVIQNSLARAVVKAPNSVTSPLFSNLYISLKSTNALNINFFLLPIKLLPLLNLLICTA